jgi:hypothetical protein
MPELSHRPRRAAGFGFSLDDAARIQACLTAGQDQPDCPICETTLSVTIAPDGSNEFDLIYCANCRASMLMSLPLIHS